MGYYTEYISTLKRFEDITTERKKQLSTISAARGRAILTIASDQGGRPEKAKAPIGIDYTDLLAVEDQLQSLSGTAIDIVLETPGGLAEITERIVELVRQKFSDVAFIVPGSAMSAGTIMAMSGDDILMDASSSLGPIDAQVMANGKRFSADAFIEGLEKIKEEVLRTGRLNPAYVPILQGISPGEIQNCENAQSLSQTLVSQWLAQYKFKDWTTHRSSGLAVTPQDKIERAKGIAKKLANHRDWLSHGRGIRISDLIAMKLQVTDYSNQSVLAEAIRRYYALIRVTFESTAIYKVFETEGSQLYRFIGQQQAAKAPTAPEVQSAFLDFQCGTCGTVTPFQVNLGVKQPIQKGYKRLPESKYECPTCHVVHDVMDMRRQIEAQSGKKIIDEES